MSLDVNNFQFHSAFENDSLTGLYFNENYLPEEIIWNIFSYIPPTKLLDLTLVCKKWCNIIKSQHFWMYLYNRSYPYKAKQYPWYIYYLLFTTNNFKNLLKNANGEEELNNWKILQNGGEGWKIENQPVGADNLPSNEDFNGHLSCFATSYGLAKKMQVISLKDKRLLLYVVEHHKPHIYVSEWMAGRFDCGCTYRLAISGYNDKFKENLYCHRCDSDFDYESDSDGDGIIMSPLFHKEKVERVAQWEGHAWKKVEIVVADYPPGVLNLVFEHEGRDSQFWAGHYGSKMAGGVLKFIFDSIKAVDLN